MNKLPRNKIAVIHVAKSKTGMTEEEYRALLGSVGVKSSKDLNGKTFQAVMSRFESLGFRSTSRHQRPHVPSKKKLLGKLNAVLADMGLKQGYADAMARNMFGIDQASWLKDRQLYKLVQALCVHQQRKRKVR